MSRCTGHCCRRFITKFSPYELQRIKLSIEDGTYNAMLDDGSQLQHTYDQVEVQKLSDMLIWLGTSEVDPATGKLGPPEHNYTCKHFDTVSGNCQNYEHRPLMCSTYPNSRVCQYRGCTHESSVERLKEIAAGKFQLGIRTEDINQGT